MTNTQNEMDLKPPTILEEPGQPAPVLRGNGLRPTNEDGSGLPADKNMDSVEQSVTRYDQSSRRAAAKNADAAPDREVDETSAGGLQYPDDSIERASR